MCDYITLALPQVKGDVGHVAKISSDGPVDGQHRRGGVHGSEGGGGKDKTGGYSSTAVWLTISVVGVIIFFTISARITGPSII